MVASISAIVVAASIASPAAAHGGGGPDATNYRSSVVAAGDPGLVWKVYGGDSLLELTNLTGSDVTVLGYLGEPYLRFSPGEGVFQNTHSPATYQNKSRYASTEVPDIANADAPPNWQRVDRSDTLAWHDHRIHWMSPLEPPGVAADRTDEQLIFEWFVPVQISDGPAREVQAIGRLQWVPDVRWWPPVVILIALFAGVAVMSIVLTTPVRSRWPGAARPVVIVLWLVLAANIVRTVDDVLAAPASLTQHLTLVGSVIVSMAVLVALTSRSWRGHAGGFAALAVAGMATMLLFGGESSRQLSASQLVTVLPSWIRRWTIASSYAVVVPCMMVAVAAGLHFTRFFRDHPDSVRARVTGSELPRHGPPT